MSSGRHDFRYSLEIRTIVHPFLRDTAIQAKTGSYFHATRVHGYFRLALARRWFAGGIIDY
jgi:hypothetical protein